MQTSSDLQPFGKLLREVRAARRLSQLDLALQAEVSQRHLSFLESGRAQPSREMILQLVQTLDLPLREQNRLLMSAGYVGIYPQRSLAEADMQPVRQALEMQLKHHEPFPALVVDRAWNQIMTNAAVEPIYALMGNLDEVWQRVCGDGPRNALKLTFHERGLRPFIKNFYEIAPPLLARTAREALEHPQVQAVLDEILEYPGIPARWRSIDLNAAVSPVLAMHLKAHGVSLRMFTMISTFGTPQDITADELRIESFFPADAQSEMLLRQLSKS